MAYPSIDQWQNLPENVQQRFKEAARHLTYRRGDIIYQQKDDPRGLYFVEKGLVGLTMVGARSGKEHLVRFFRGGQFFGHRSLFSQEGHHGAAVALEETLVHLVPGTVVFEVLDQNPQLFKFLVEVLAKELRRCEVQHVLILENQVLARTASAIVYLKELKPDYRWTRQEIANFSGSTVATVIRALAELEDRKLIRQDGRQIEVLNRDALICLQDDPSA